MTATPRPRVLISRAEDVTGERWQDYADRITEAGGAPVDLALDAWQRSGTPDAAPPIEYDALVLTGGVDIDPACYGEARSERVTEVNPERDRYELALLRAALEHDVPVLAICRGHQLLNVASGGTLLQHIEERDPHRSRRGADGVTIESGWHDVTLEEGSLLRSVLGTTLVHTNSRHHQAVTPDRVAPPLRVAGTTEDGIVEALEDPAHRWVVSVQWHPERPEVAASFAPLFAALVEAARDRT